MRSWDRSQINDGRRFPPVINNLYPRVRVHFMLFPSAPWIKIIL